MRVAFIGLGKLGLPCAEVMAEKGHDVTGYDIKRCKTKNVYQFPTIQGAIQGRDIVFVAVPTPHDPDYDGKAPTSHLAPKDFSYDIVKEVLKECNKHMNKHQMLVLISTVLPGTVRKELYPLVANTRFVYNPYLIAMGTVAHDMKNPEMVIIGTHDGTETGDAQELRQFYETIMDNFPRYVIGTWDECECIKVFYNTFISTKIGLVNMIQDVAESQGNIDVDIVTTALAESTQRIMGPSYMKAGMGDGGACHPRDNIALRYLSEKLDLGYDLFGSIMKAREVQAKNMAETILIYGDAVFFTSDSYKPGVEYTDGSYSLLVQHYVNEMGGFIVRDPNQAEIIVRVHPHDVVPDNTEAVIFDPWRQKNSDIQYGNTRQVMKKIV